MSSRLVSAFGESAQDGIERSDSLEDGVGSLGMTYGMMARADDVALERREYDQLDYADPVEDSVREYLREIGQVSLLTAADERDLARNVEASRRLKEIEASQRATARMLGVDESTVRADLNKGRAGNPAVDWFADVRADLEFGDFREVLADLTHVDAIITGPPLGCTPFLDSVLSAQTARSSSRLRWVIDHTRNSPWEGDALVKNATGRLDRVASVLEKHGDFKMAHQIDKISESIEARYNGGRV